MKKPLFQRRHYLAIANAIANDPGLFVDAGRVLADLFECDNPTFDRVSFFKIAGCIDARALWRDERIDQ